MTTEESEQIKALSGRMPNCAEQTRFSVGVAFFAAELDRPRRY